MNIPVIADEFSSAKLLGVGESSHGTHEFFDFKFNLFKELVRKHDFNTLFFEDSPLACEAINMFIANGEGDLDKLMKELYSVWRVEELKQLILWLRENHIEYKVEFVGFDIDQTNKNIQKRDGLMAKNIRRCVESSSNTKALIWAHNSHLQVTGSDSNQKPTGLFLRKYYRKEYIAVALLFGVGTVSATRLKAGTPTGSDRTLSTVSINSIPSEIVESILHRLDTTPFYLTRKQMEEIITDKLKIRSIGWGLDPELVNKVVEQTDIKKSFDGIIYFPKTTASQPIKQ